MYKTMDNDTITVGELGVRFLVEAADSSGSVSVFECYVPADSRMPAPHSHDAFEETIYGLKGTTIWTIDGAGRPESSGRDGSTHPLGHTYPPTHPSRPRNCATHSVGRRSAPPRGRLMADPPAVGRIDRDAGLTIALTLYTGSRVPAPLACQREHPYPVSRETRWRRVVAVRGVAV